MANFYTDVNINPDSPMNVRVQPRVRTVQFGDGYEMSVQDGLNADLRIYDLTFTNVTTAQADTINNFLTARKGVESFDWQAPFTTTTKKYKCSSWVRKYLHANIETVTAQFREVAIP